MFCHKCGTKLPVDSGFCHKCGVAIVEETVLIDADSQKTTVEPTPQIQPVIQTTAVPNAAPKRSRTMPVIVVIAVVIIGGIALSVNNKSTNEPTDYGYVSNSEADSTASPTTVSEINVTEGDTIKFGDYIWRVLDVQGDRALILSDKTLESKDFYDYTSNKNWDNTWENSQLRHYMNNDFINKILSANERACIIETTIENKDNPWFGDNGGNNTTDKLFALSIEEVVEYFGDSGQLSNRPTDAFVINDQYNYARIAKNNDTGEADSWWLRSTMGRGHIFACVGLQGHIFIGQNLFISDSQGIRPALWLDLAAFSKLDTPTATIATERSLDPSNSATDNSNYIDGKFEWVIEPTMQADYIGGGLFGDTYVAPTRMGSTVTGSVKNVTNKSFSSVAIEFIIYDRAGNQIDTAIGYISSLGAGNTWKFEASCFTNEAAYFEFSRISAF